MPFTNTILALDLSLSSPGFAVIAFDSEGNPLLLEKSHVKTKASKPHGYRLGEISEEVDRYIVAYQPEHYVREKGFSRHAKTTQALFKVVGVSDLYAYMRTEREIAEIAPTSVKKLVTGNGKASKQEVEVAVKRILRIEIDDFFATDDESDACAVGLAYAVKKRLLTI